MGPIINRTWDLLAASVAQAKQQDIHIDCNQNAFDKYKKIFKDKYDFIKINFMKSSVSALDRHKVASIIIASIIESDSVIYNQKISDGKVFFGKYQIAVSVGLSYMLDQLNEMLAKKSNKIEKYWFPEAFSCKTPYFDIFARNLYFTHEKTNWNLNLLDIAEILFLLEYMTLQKNGIDPSLLNDEDSTEE